MKEQNYYWKALWMTEGSAALAVREETVLPVSERFRERERAESAEERFREQRERENGAEELQGQERPESAAEELRGRERSESAAEVFQGQERSESAAEVFQGQERLESAAEAFWEEKESESAAALTCGQTVFETDLEETEGDDGWSCAGKVMCGMAALLEEYLLFLVTGIKVNLTPPVTVLFFWILLVVISAETVKMFGE